MRKKKDDFFFSHLVESLLVFFIFSIVLLSNDGQYSFIKRKNMGPKCMENDKTTDKRRHAHYHLWTLTLIHQSNNDINMRSWKTKGNWFCDATKGKVFSCMISASFRCDILHSNNFEIREHGKTCFILRKEYSNWPFQKY